MKRPLNPNGVMPANGRMPEFVFAAIVGSGYLSKMLSAPTMIVPRRTGPKLSDPSVIHRAPNVWSPVAVVPNDVTCPYRCVRSTMPARPLRKSPESKKLLRGLPTSRRARSTRLNSATDCPGMIDEVSTRVTFVQFPLYPAVTFNTLLDENVQP